jgi:hypothetical protein
MLSEMQEQFLRKVARKYIWWKTPDEAMQFPQLLLAKIMDIGTWKDLCEMTALFSDDEMREILASAEAGQFRAKSWNFWHIKLIDGAIPPMPMRRFVRSPL